MKTRELQTLWWDWLSTCERALRSMHEQTAALTLRDVKRVERIQPELDHLLGLIRDIDDRAAACAGKLAEEFGTEPNLRSLVQALPEAEAQQVQALANRVIVAARNLQNVADRNRALVENELDYINGTLTMIAQSSTDPKHPFEGNARAAVLLDQVA